MICAVRMHVIEFTKESVKYEEAVDDNHEDAG